jgi:hypothetical protein
MVTRRSYSIQNSVGPKAFLRSLVVTYLWSVVCVSVVVAQSFKLHLCDIICNQLTVIYSYALKHVVMYFTHCGGHITGVYQ